MTFAQGIGVTYSTVNNDARNAARLSLSGHDFAQQRAAQVAFAIDDQDIAGLRNRHRGMNRQIITRTDFHGDGRTRNGHVRSHRFDAAVKRTAATGHVGQNGGLILGSPTNVLGRNAFELAINRFFFRNGHECLHIVLLSTTQVYRTKQL